MSIISDLMALRSTQPEAIVEDHELDHNDYVHFIDELEESHKVMIEQMEHVRSIVRQLPRSMRGQAEAYWIPHIMIALGGEHEWMTAGHESTMQKTIEELKEESKQFHDSEPTGDDDGDHEYR